MPPDRRPVQRVLDWLNTAAPSAYSEPYIAARLRMPEQEVSLIIVGLAEDGFVVREYTCVRAAREDDPEL